MPCLWFDDDVEEAIDFYTSLFPETQRASSVPMPDGTPNPAKNPRIVTFTLLGQEFIAFNGGPMFKFNEAVSFVVTCDTQDEIDHYWNALTANGGEASQCGWLKDRFGLSWQIVPKRLGELMAGDDAARSKRVMDALMEMGKLDVAALEKAAAN